MRSSPGIPVSRKFVRCERPVTETLEPRRLFAGNVVVAIDPVNFVVNVRGDNQDEAIQLSGSTGPGFVITGLSGTTVNGQPSVTVHVQNSFNIHMGNGNDMVQLLDFDNTAAIVMGNGNDVVDVMRVDFLSPGDSVSIITGNGSDTVSVTDSYSSVNSNVSIITGNGIDSVNVSNCFCGSVSIVTGNANDLVTVGLLHGITNLSIKTGNGDDQVALSDINIFSNGPILTIQVGNGTNLVSLNLVSFDTANSVFKAGTGEDTLTVTRFNFMPRVTNPIGFEIVTDTIIPFGD
jgi:hypothetical protein